ncbi:hypothetical protein SDC9_71982 [bioreactor metagenome]|uniref:Uncharacterized protein n=1 Tax=bioreactor metagenome TaxID=1076179 RepID=A0A644YBD4_9ZZZZ
MVDRDLYLARSQVNTPEEIGTDRHQLSICFRAVGANEIDIPLEELARTAFLRAFVAPERPKRPPAQR